MGKLNNLELIGYWSDYSGKEVIYVIVFFWGLVQKEGYSV